MACESPALYQQHLGQTTEPRGLSASSSLTTETPFLRYFGFVPIWFLLLDFSLFFSLFLFFRLFAVQFCFLTVCPPVFQDFGTQTRLSQKKKAVDTSRFFAPVSGFFIFFWDKISWKFLQDPFKTSFLFWGNWTFVYGKPFRNSKRFIGKNILWSFTPVSLVILWSSNP